MSISMFAHQYPTNTHNVYQVRFHEHTIKTIVTNTPSYVDAWISETQRGSSHVVGLDVEWRPSYTRNFENPVATLQLCVGRRCLIFQILHSHSIPLSLVNLLGNTFYTFNGVGIQNDVEKLRRDYNLVVARTADLGALAADVYGVRELRNAGLKELSSRVVGREMEKPMNVTMSRWDDECLTPAQVHYATVDAFLSYEIGRVMMFGNRN